MNTTQDQLFEMTKELTPNKRRAEAEAHTIPLFNSPWRPTPEQVSDKIKQVKASLLVKFQKSGGREQRAFIYIDRMTGSEKLDWITERDYYGGFGASIDERDVLAEVWCGVGYSGNVEYSVDRF